MKVFQLSISFVFLLLLARFVVAQKNNGFNPYYIKTNSIECYGNPKILVNVTCKLKPINWEKTVATMDSDLVDVVKNATLRLELFKYGYTNQFRPFHLNVTFNLCKMLETRKGNPYGKLVMNILSQFTTVTHNCPYRGHVAAFGIYMNSRSVPFIIPSGKYKFVLTFYEGWPMVLIGTAIFNASVIERNHMSRTT